MQRSCLHRGVRRSELPKPINLLIFRVILEHQRNACLTLDGRQLSQAAFVGTGSVRQRVCVATCSAMACHNGNQAKGTPGSEYTTWVTLDPHACPVFVFAGNTPRSEAKFQTWNFVTRQTSACF